MRRHRLAPPVKGNATKTASAVKAETASATCVSELNAAPRRAHPLTAAAGIVDPDSHLADRVTATDLLQLFLPANRRRSLSLADRARSTSFASSDRQTALSVGEGLAQFHPLQER
ncbi:MAG: hypothetical protein JWM24_2002 [Solirubrobacterales bacterium]|nr:hypothetical protein [Solirubrobacterales bacterium]